MIAKVLYCHKTEFTGKDGEVVTGYQVGVTYNDRDKKMRCREIWGRDEFDPEEIAELVYSRNKQKWYLFKAAM